MTAKWRSAGEIHLNENEDVTLPVFDDASVSGTIKCTMLRCKTCPGIRVVDNERIHFHNWAAKDTGSIYKSGLGTNSIYYVIYAVLSLK